MSKAVSQGIPMGSKNHMNLRIRVGGLQFLALTIAGLGCVTLAVGCTQTVRLHGQTMDISGQALPGVVVRVAGVEHEALSSILGQYRLRTVPGELQLEFFKTGYTPAQITISAPTPGVIEAPPIQLWPLPIGEGVYLFENHRYYQTDHPRVNRYRLEATGLVFGTPVEAQLAIDWADPDKTPELNPPMLIAHRLPAYDARLHRLRQVNAAPAPVVDIPGAASPARQTQYTETVWVADEGLPLRSRAIDEPEKLLVELRAAQPLAPGTYAVHWGALEGYDSIDPRVFLFRIVAPPDEEESAEDEEAQEDNHE